MNSSPTPLQKDYCLKAGPNWEYQFISFARFSNHQTCSDSRFVVHWPVVLVGSDSPHGVPLHPLRFVSFEVPQGKSLSKVLQTFGSYNWQPDNPNLLKGLVSIFFLIGNHLDPKNVPFCLALRGQMSSTGWVSVGWVICPKRRFDLSWRRQT